MTTYTIEITSRGQDVGIGKITQSQYEYWSDDDREYELGEALQSNYDYEENETPEECRLHDYYNEYDDIASFSGSIVERSIIKISNQQGHLLFDADPYQYAAKLEFEEDFFEYDEEFHSWNSYDVSGYFIKWRLDGIGIYFRGEFKSEEFLIEKLKILIVDIDNDRIIRGIFYDREPIENSGGEFIYSSSDFQIDFNQKLK